jgi:DNA-binding NarL/FixJ family response regulator
MMRDGLRAIIAQEEGFDVVGEAANGHEAVALARRLKPQVVIMDISMPELNGVDATRQLLLEQPGLKVIALSMNADRRYVLAMFKAGAVGYLLKNSASDELIQALRAVTEDLTYVSPSIAAVVVDNYVSSTSSGSTDKPLSPREREVLQLLAEGKSSKDIASRLNLALPTVETHRRQIMDKLGLRTIAELTKYAIREGLTSLD